MDHYPVTDWRTDGQTDGWTESDAQKGTKITFYNMATLTFDLRTHMRHYQGQSSHQILGSYLKRFAHESAE